MKDRKGRGRTCSECTPCAHKDVLYVCIVCGSSALVRQRQKEEKTKGQTRKGEQKANTVGTKNIDR